jgi:2,3-bisphosphoglycerate-dependent phosphoglycerate mutase
MAEIRQLRFVAPPGAARLLLVRHGESAPVRDGVAVPLLDGCSNPELDPVGHEQAGRLAERLANEDVAAIYVTPLVRTRQTAAPLAERLALEPRVEPALQEIFLGEWEGGHFRRHVRDQHPITVKLLDEQRWEVIPGAEPSARFEARVREGIERIAAAHPDETAVVVAHGGTISQALATATAARPFSFMSVDNASISELVVAGGHWIVRRFNDIAHLAA